MFVASSAPPIPVSNTTISHSFFWKYKNASAVSISKEVGCGFPSAVSISQAFFKISINSPSSLFDIILSFIKKRSLYVKIVGET